MDAFRKREELVKDEEDMDEDDDEDQVELKVELGKLERMDANSEDIKHDHMNHENVPAEAAREY